MQERKINIFDLTYAELEAYVEQANQPRFRAEQLADWLYKKLVFDIASMDNISKSFKDLISRDTYFYMPDIEHVSCCKSDNSYKFLLKTNDEKLIESILMRDKGRSTICVSCMIGCPLACKFCATGSQIGFIRPLTVAEIVGQVLAIVHYARLYGYAQKVDNIVFMGMGEPLLNKVAVEKAIDIFTHERCFALSPSRISVSTSGVGEGLAEFIHKTGVRLAVSLHFTTNELRSQYMPVNKHFSLDNLITELKKIRLKKRDYILIEYIMFKGINDSIEHAKKLFKLIVGLKVKVNLIPYNPTETLNELPSNEQTIYAFVGYLQEKGIFTSVRRSKGTDVDGGCGQFALKKV